MLTEVSLVRDRGFDIKAGILIDGLTVALLFVVTLISLLVHIFSTEYMRDDRRKTHYFAALSPVHLRHVHPGHVVEHAPDAVRLGDHGPLLVHADRALVGVEGQNSNAALKAFFTTRTGDIGLLVGISILFFVAGQTFDIEAINAGALTGDSTRAY